jgi:hypothetical protein
LLVSRDVTTETWTVPGARPLGTVATIEVELQVFMVAVVPPKLTLPEPCMEPKLLP